MFVLGVYWGTHSKQAKVVILEGPAKNEEKKFNFDSLSPESKPIKRSADGDGVAETSPKQQKSSDECKRQLADNLYGNLEGF